MFNVYIETVRDVYKKCTMFMEKLDKTILFLKMLIMCLENVKHVYESATNPRVVLVINNNIYIIDLIFIANRF